MAATWHGNPYLARQLRGQLVKLQRGEQAEYRLRYFNGYRSQAFVLGDRAAGQSVETSPDTLQLAGGRQARKHHPWCTDSVQIAGAQQFLLLEQVKDALLVSGVLHECMHVPFIRSLQEQGEYTELS